MSAVIIPFPIRAKPTSDGAMSTARGDSGGALVRPLHGQRASMAGWHSSVTELSDSLLTLSAHLDELESMLQRSFKL